MIPAIKGLEAQHTWVGEQRWHQSANGQKYPGVTTVLSATMTERKRAGLERWRERVGHAEAERIKMQGAARGTKLHNMVERYLQEDIPGEGPWWFSLVDELSGITDIKMIEGALWKDVPGVGGYAGSVDLVGCYDGKLTVVDWKTSRKRKRRDYIDDYFMQATAYAAAFNARYSDVCPKVRDVAIVVAYDGKPCDVFKLGKADMLYFWGLFVERLREFHASRSTP